MHLERTQNVPGKIILARLICWPLIAVCIAVILIGFTQPELFTVTVVEHSGGAR